MPQIIIDDKHIGGYNELVEHFADKGLVNFKHLRTLDFSNFRWNSYEYPEEKDRHRKLDLSVLHELKDLTKLNLSGNIYDYHSRFPFRVFDLDGFTNLVSLNLSSTGTTDVTNGGEALKHLKHLDVTDTEIELDENAHLLPTESLITPWIMVGE